MSSLSCLIHTSPPGVPQKCLSTPSCVSNALCPLVTVALSDIDGKQTIYKAKVVGVDPDKVTRHDTRVSKQDMYLHAAVLACCACAAEPLGDKQEALMKT